MGILTGDAPLARLLFCFTNENLRKHLRFVAFATDFDGKTLDDSTKNSYTNIACGIGGFDMLSQLAQAAKVVGVKQSNKAIKEGRAAGVFIADDAEQRVIRPIADLCRQMNVPLTEVPTMAELGDAAGIDVGAAVVTILAE